MTGKRTSISLACYRGVLWRSAIKSIIVSQGRLFKRRDKGRQPLGDILMSECRDADAVTGHLSPANNGLLLKGIFIITRRVASLYCPRSFSRMTVYYKIRNVYFAQF